MLESSFENRVKTWAKRRGIICLKYSSFKGGVIGYPDDWFYRRFPEIAIIEFKKEGGKPTPIQEYRIADLQERGYPVKVVRSFHEGIEFLREVFRDLD